MTDVTDPRIRSWLVDPGQTVSARVDEQAGLAAMALQGVRELVPGARLVVFVPDDVAQRRWRSELIEHGLTVATSPEDHTAGDAVVMAFHPSVLLGLSCTPEEVWVDDGGLETANRDVAGGAWQLLFRDAPVRQRRVGVLALPPEVSAAQRWLAARLAPRPVEVAHSDAVCRAAEVLGIAPGDVVRSRLTLGPTDGHLLMWTLEAVRVPGSELTDSAGAEEPRRTRRSLGDDHIEVLVDAALEVDWAGTRAVVHCVPTTDDRFHVDVFTTGSSPSRLLDEALDHARGPGNPHRGRVVEVQPSTSRRGVPDVGALELRGVPVPVAHRSELVLADEVWRALDVDVGGVFQRADLLARAGLGTNRGVLLEGPPGVGKTHAVRVLMAELVGDVTVILVPGGLGDQLTAVYDHARLLAPTLVVIEDIDLVAGTTRSAGARMHALLEALDGLMAAHGQVVTVATTNRAAEMDEAVRRAARFDRIVEFAPPPLAGRRRILERYLAPVGAEDLDLDHLAAVSEGATGADLREVVRHAILEVDGPLTTGALVDAVRARSLYRAPGGAYL